MNFYTNFVGFMNNLLYQPYIVPLFLIVAGLVFTVGTKFIQFRCAKETFRVVLEEPAVKGGISSFNALMVSTASRVGTGNIIGVSTALCTGGPGAIFWLWVTALLGGASAYVESTLAQIYKRRDEDGTSYGGPSYYMETALGQRWLGAVFAVIIILTYAVGYNMLASYNLQSCFVAFDFYKEGVTPLVIGVILALLFGTIIYGGARRLSKAAGFLVPFMGIAYILVALLVMILNADKLGAMFAMIFSDAFNFKAIFGGFFGSCIMWGIKRGLYSNEAGMGSAPNAAATADVTHPAKQGLVQMLSVFIDSLLICTATAFMCLSTGVIPTVEQSGAPYVQAAMAETLGGFGPVFIAVSLSLFAFTTLIGNYYYCEGCLRFLLKRKPSQTLIGIFRIIATMLVMVGAVLSAGIVWDTADMLQGLMVIINIPVILILGKKAFVCLEDYMAQRKAGKEPVYNAKACGITEETDYWND